MELDFHVKNVDYPLDHVKTELPDDQFVVLEKLCWHIGRRFRERRAQREQAKESGQVPLAELQTVGSGTDDHVGDQESSASPAEETAPSAEVGAVGSSAEAAAADSPAEEDSTVQEHPNDSETTSLYSESSVSYRSEQSGFSDDYFSDSSDIFGLDIDEDNPECYPVVNVWTNLSEQLKEDEIPSPIEFAKQCKAITEYAVFVTFFASEVTSSCSLTYCAGF